MALWIAKWVGAEIFATVGSSDKKHLLMDKFNIPATHIFYSRNTSFAQGIMRLTGGYGVDVVLNSPSGDGLRASWECIAQYGRFVEIGKTDIGLNAALPMASFSRNTSFFAVDLHHIALSNPRLTGELMLEVVGLLQQGVIHYPSPLHIYSISEVEKAFRHMQSGKSTGRIIITAERSNMVPVSLDPDKNQPLHKNVNFAFRSCYAIALAVNSPQMHRMWLLVALGGLDVRL